MFAFALLVLAQDPTPPAATPPAAPPAAAAEPGAVPFDEGAVVDALEEVLAHGKDVVRLAIPPIDDADVTRRAALERSIVRAVRDRRREEVVTPALLRAKLRAQAEAQARDVAVDELKPFACDHVLYATVVTEGDSASLHLRLLNVESGAVLGETSAKLGNAAVASSTSASSVRAATEDLVEQIAYSIEGKGIDIREHHVGVPPLVAAEGAPKESRLDRFVQAELVRALLHRGFLVVERTKLDAALQQMSLGQELGEKDAPELGKLAGADSLVLGQVADGATAFIVTVRVVDVTTGAVIGAGSSSLPRNDVVARADVETRTPGEAAMRSAIAPGWGQAYNGQGLKALAFGIGGYGGVLATAGLGVASAVAYSSYLDVKPGADLTAEEAGQRASDLRGLTNGLLLSTGVAACVTAVVWGVGIVDALIASPSEGGA